MSFSHSDDARAQDRPGNPPSVDRPGSPPAPGSPGAPPSGAGTEDPPVADPPPRAAHDPVDVFVRRIRRILGDPQIAARVSAAGISVRIDLSDVPDRVITLLFDRTPPTVQDTGPAQPHPTVRLMLDSRELDGLLNEGSHLPMAILGGAVTFEGSVRKFLRVMPIIRGGALRFDTEEEFEAGR